MPEGLLHRNKAYLMAFSLLMQISFQLIDFCITGVRWCSFDHLLLYSEESGCIFPFFRSTFEQHFREVVRVAYWYVWARLVIKYFDMGSGHALTAESHGSLYLALFSKHCILMCALWSLVYVFFNVDSLSFSQAVSERGIPVSQITRNLIRVCQYLSLYLDTCV